MNMDNKSNPGIKKLVQTGIPAIVKKLPIISNNKEHPTANARISFIGFAVVKPIGFAKLLLVIVLKGEPTTLRTPPKHPVFCCRIFPFGITTGVVGTGLDIFNNIVPENGINGIPSTKTDSSVTISRMTKCLTLS